MTAHQRIVDAARRVRQPIYLVTALYVGVGFIVGAYGAIRGDRLAACLGFFFISGAICAALLFHVMARLAVRVSAIGVSVDELRGSLARVERAVMVRTAGEPVKQPKDASGVQVVNLAEFGRGDPSSLVSATLDRSRFPRLVTAMDEDGIATPGATPTSEVSKDALGPGEELRSDQQTTPTASEVANRNLAREWRAAQQSGDLAACRNVYSAIVDTADPVVVAEFAEQMVEISASAERSLRAAFASCVQRRDYAGALEAGRQIIEYFPGEPVAAEFLRIKPYLLRRVGSPSAEREHTLSASPS